MIELGKEYFVRIPKENNVFSVIENKNFFYSINRKNVQCCKIEQCNCRIEIGEHFYITFYFDGIFRKVVVYKKDMFIFEEHKKLKQEEMEI